MKIPLLLSSLLFSSLLLFTHAARAQMGAVSIQAEVSGSNKEDYKTETSTEEKVLKITVMNTSRANLANLKVQYSFFGKDVASHQTSVIKTESKDVSLASLASTVIDTEPATASYTKEHFDKPPRGKSKGAGKLLPAKGTKYEGYGIQVYNGSQLLGELFSPENLKEKAPAAPQ